MRWQAWICGFALLAVSAAPQSAECSDVSRQMSSQRRSLNDIVRNGIGDPDGGSDRHGEHRTQFVYRLSSPTSPPGVRHTFGDRHATPEWVRGVLVWISEALRRE